MQIIHKTKPCCYAERVTNWLQEYENKAGINIPIRKTRKEELRSDLNGLYLLEDDTVLAGGLTFYIYNDWVFLCCAYIKPEYRGQKLFSEIMGIVFNMCKRYGMSGIHVSTYEFEAPHIYEHLGFTKGNVMHGLPKGNTSIDYYIHFGEEKI